MITSAIPPQPDFLIQLRRAQHAVRVQLDAELEVTGLTTPQFMVLAALAEGAGLSASDLAREFGMTAQTVNVLVKSLERSGLLSRSPQPGHGRILLAHLTESGHQALGEGREIAMAVQHRIVGRLSQADRNRLLALLQAVEETAASSPWTAAGVP
jgi:DNA-binding MarR family transcriptional regulator